MLSEIFLAVLVVVVFILVAVDFYRTTDETLPGHADVPLHDVRPRTVGDTRGGRAEAFLPESAAVHDVGPTWRPESVSPSADGHQYARTGPSPVHGRSRRGLKDWPVRSRLLLLVIIPAVAVTVAAFCVVRIADILRGAPTHSPSVGAIVSALAIGVVVIIVLLLASWFAILVARSVLQPLHRLRVGVLEMSGVRLPDTVRHNKENNGDGGPSDMKPIDVDSSDEIGELARAFEQMRREMLRLAANEAAVRGKLDGMFVNLSHRSQSLVERQIRIIEGLEQGEKDRERLASLFKMDRIAARMHRNSQNLLILAGHDIATGWNQPVALVNVIRAAVSEIEEYERVSLNAQPDITVRGPAVNDVVHLFAELIENATSFSAAEMPVDISGQLMTSGGVVVDITDRGVGMSAKEMAYANWQLENQPAKDINVLKWMGLFVVARLAARHGIRIRLQQAEFGGLTALVWLPDEVIAYQGAAASPRPGRFGDVGSRPGLHEEVAHPGYATTEQRVTSTRSTEFTPGYEEMRDMPLDRRLTSDTRRPPSPTWSAGNSQSAFRADEPSGTVRGRGSRLPDAMGQHAGVSGQQVQDPGDGAGAGDIVGGTLLTGQLSAPGLSASGQSEMSQFASAPMQTGATLSRETNSADGSVIVPPAEDLAETHRLPIFDAVESHWFRGDRKVPDASGLTDAAGSRWSSPADEGWHAAQTVDSPSSGGQTTAGLPKRLPNANLVPGAIPSTQPVAPNRSAAEARDRLAGFQRGFTQGRAVGSETANPGGVDES
jgi:signal transduction histidine kinase